MSEKPRQHKARGPMGGGPMGMGGSGVKAKNFGKSFKRLLSYLKPNAISFVLIIIFAICSVGLEIQGPKVLGTAITKLFGGVMSKTVSETLTDLNGGTFPEGMTKDKLVTFIDAAKSEEFKQFQESAQAGRPNPVLLPKSIAGDPALMQFFGNMMQTLAAKQQSGDSGGLGASFVSGEGPDLSGMLSSLDGELGANAKIDFEGIGRILINVLLLYVIGAFLSWIQSFINAGISTKIVYNMRRQIDEKLTRLPLKYFDTNPRGDILSRITNDVDNIQQSLQQSLNQVITAVLTVIFTIVMMFSISITLALISMGAVVICLAVAGLVASRSQKHFKKQWQSTGDLNAHVEEMYTGHNIVKVFGKQQEAIEVFEEHNNNLYQSAFRAQFISGVIMPSMNFINNLNYVAICIVGGLSVAAGRMDFGNIQAFIQYSRRLNQPLTQTASIMNVLQSMIASAERVFELLDEPEQELDAADSVKLEKVKGYVAFENVDFSYDAENPLIKDLNLQVSPGQSIAIVGHTGAGKTTLVNLLMRFYEVQGGKITIDGTDIRQMKRDDLRNTFGMVLQDTWLFNGSIKENIAYGAIEKPTDEAILAASNAAYVDRFVRHLPEGYETVLNDNASNISQGQRQLITIARAFLSNPDILILDEATSSVDTRTEVLIQKAMAKLMKGRTSFVIAHRLSTIRDADIILVMDKGSVMEQGNHAELMAKKGFYYDMFISQFSNEETA
ncbi:MAG: ABC transporter ATP-binding protein/permease [Oscillospiraceae bacterium]|jgi:ATP-binding cassette subfamily B protein|nr:ABC transporter ATP-binding protein/permease [Oscillospiraceae bacterium]